jgi:inner membrane protein
MDTVTHGLAGTLIAQAGFRQRMGSVATVALTVSAIAPDIDGVVRYRDIAFYLEYHRGITHSFIGGAGLALILAAIFYRFSAYKHYWRLAGLCYLGIISHILLDLLTSYGTMIFLPISDRRFAWDTLFIIDVFVSGIIIAGIALAYRLPSRSVPVGRTALGLVGAYIFLAAMGHQLALARLQSYVDRAGLDATSIAAFPMPFGPLRWSGVVATEQATYQTLFSLLDRADPPTEVYPPPPESALIRRAEVEDVVAQFRRFARFPVVSVLQGTDGPVVQYFDLQFNQIKGRQPFLVEVAFDEEGRLRFSGFARR